MIRVIIHLYLIQLHVYPGTWDQGGRGGPCVPPLELRFYVVKIFQMSKISFFYYSGPPLVKIVPRALIIYLYQFMRIIYLSIKKDINLTGKVELFLFLLVLPEKKGAQNNFSHQNFSVENLSI